MQKNRSEVVKFGIIRRYIPYVMPCWNETSYDKTQCKEPGMAIEILEELCSHIQIRCQYIAVNHSMFGDNLTGEWRGIIRQIMDDEFDSSLPVFSPTTERRKVVDFSIPLFIANPTLITRFPTPSNFSLWSIFGFNSQSWALILGTIFLIGLLSAVFDWFQHGESIYNNSDKTGRLSLKRYSVNIVRLTLDATSLFTDQGVADRNFSASLCVLFGIWSLCCVVLAGIYSSHILIAAMDNSLHLPFTELSSLASCIKNDGCALTTVSKSTSFFDMVANAKSGAYLEMQQALNMRPPIMERKEHIVKSVVSNFSRYHVVYGSMGYYAGLIKSNPACTLDAVTDTVPSWFTLPFHKESPLKDRFNAAITVLKEVGVIQKILEAYVGNYISAQDVFCKEQMLAFKSMGVTVFYGPFLVVGAGSIFGLVILLFEKVWRANFSKSTPVFTWSQRQSIKFRNSRIGVNWGLQKMAKRSEHEKMFGRKMVQPSYDGGEPVFRKITNSF